MTWRDLRWRAEAALLAVVVAGLRRLSPVAATNLGGAMARAIGPLLPVSRVADRNLLLAMPGLDRAARRRVVRGVWDNLGRTAAETVQLDRLHRNEFGAGWEVEGEAHARRMADHPGPVIVVTGHFANWEMLPRAAAEYGIRLATVYRAGRNPHVEARLARLRVAAAFGSLQLFPKGAVGARQAIGHLRGGGRLVLLTDQKMNDGIAARLFGHDAMTASAAATLALRFKALVVPTYCRRLGPARMLAVCEAPLPLPDTGDRLADVATLTQAINDRLEAWIRAQPQDWLWLHRRWPRETYEDGK